MGASNSWERGNSFSKGGKGKTKSTRSTGEALVSSSGPLCAFCQGSHWSDKCLKVKGLKQMKEYINDNNLCFGCLKVGHQFRACKSKRPCFYCKKSDHHSAICNDDNQTSQNWRKGAKGGRASKNEESKGESLSALHAMEYSNKVVLMTVLAKVTNTVTGRSITCRAILDTACDTTFIKETSARKLGLEMEALPVTEVGGAVVRLSLLIGWCGMALVPILGYIPAPGYTLSLWGRGSLGQHHSLRFPTFKELKCLL